MKKPKFTYREISSFCLEFSLFLHAGASSGDALALLAEESASEPLKKLFLEMGEKVDSGSPLSDVLEETGLFPNDVSSMLRVGEQTGKSEETLMALSKYYDRLDGMDRQMRSAVLYPSVLMLVMLAVVILLLAYVLPIFSDVYASLGGGLTGLAGFLLSFGLFLRDVLPVLCVAAAAVIALLVFFSCSQSFRARVSGVGGGKDRGVSKRVNASRFARALSMAVSSGLTFDEAVERAGTLLASPRAAVRCKACVDRIAEGTAPADALGESGLLPAPECRLIALGLRGGNIDAAAQEVARRLERDADEALENAVSRTEPIMVVVSSLLIGLILLSVMLPLTNIMSSIG